MKKYYINISKWVNNVYGYETIKYFDTHDEALEYAREHESMLKPEESFEIHEFTPVEKRITDYMAIYGLNLSQLAVEVGLSVSRLSKIKNGNASVTDNVREKFSHRFPEYVLINDKPKWKTLYEEEKAKNEALAEDIARVSEDNEILRKRIDTVINYLKTGELPAGFYTLNLGARGSGKSKSLKDLGEYLRERKINDGV